MQKDHAPMAVQCIGMPTYVLFPRISYELPFVYFRAIASALYTLRHPKWAYIKKLIYVDRK